MSLNTLGAAGEVHAGEVAVREQHLGNHGGVAGDEVDHPRRQAGVLEQLHDVVRREHRARGRLPDDRVAHQRRRGRQVRGNRREIERRDGVDEPLERAVLELVPHRVIARRLLGEQFLAVVGVEAPEVDDLARGIDLRLERRLRLPQHRRGVERVAPRRRQQLGRLEQHRRAIVDRTSATTRGAPAVRRRLPGRRALRTAL